MSTIFCLLFSHPFFISLILLNHHGALTLRIKIAENLPFLAVALCSFPLHSSTPHSFNHYLDELSFSSSQKDPLLFTKKREREREIRLVSWNGGGICKHIYLSIFLLHHMTIMLVSKQFQEY